MNHLVEWLIGPIGESLEPWCSALHSGVLCDVKCLQELSVVLRAGWESGWSLYVAARLGRWERDLDFDLETSRGPASN